MSRYIDADKLLKGYEDHELISTHLIWNAPTADVVEVRHGHWEEQQPRYRLYKCSVCNKVCFAEMWGDETVLYNYYPNCGARMDGEEE